MSAKLSILLTSVHLKKTPVSIPKKLLPKALFSLLIFVIKKEKGFQLSPFMCVKRKMAHVEEEGKINVKCLFVIQCS